MTKRQADMGFRESPDKPWTMGDGRLVHDERSYAAAEKEAVLLTASPPVPPKPDEIRRKCAEAAARLNKSSPQKVVLQCTIQLEPKSIEILLGDYADHATDDQIDDSLRAIANSIFKDVPVGAGQKLSIGWRAAEESDYE